MSIYNIFNLKVPIKKQSQFLFLWFTFREILGESNHNVLPIKTKKKSDAFSLKREIYIFTYTQIKTKSKYEIIYFAAKNIRNKWGRNRQTLKKNQNEEGWLRFLLWRLSTRKKKRRINVNEGRTY